MAERRQDGSPAVRLRMAYAVREALGSVEELDIIELDREPPISHDGSEFLGDFVLGVLDVRLLTVLLPAVHQRDQLADPELLETAQRTLERSTDADAVVLVANDDGFGAVIVEPFDRPETRYTPNGETAVGSQVFGPADLVRAVRAYVEPFVVQWSVVAALPTFDLEGVEGSASSAAASAVQVGRARTWHTAEKREARDRLSDSDGAWATDLALSVLRGDDSPDVIQALANYLDSSP